MQICRFEKSEQQMFIFKVFFQSYSIVSATEVENFSSLLNNSTRIKLIKPQQKPTTHKAPETLDFWKAQS